LRTVEDYHVDRPGVEAQQCVKLTGTNRSIGLIVLIASAHQSALGASMMLSSVLTRVALRTGRVTRRDGRLALRSFAPVSASCSLEKTCSKRPDRNSETSIGYSLLPIRSKKSSFSFWFYPASAV